MTSAIPPEATVLHGEVLPEGFGPLAVAVGRSQLRERFAGGEPPEALGQGTVEWGQAIPVASLYEPARLDEHSPLAFDARTAHLASLTPSGDLGGHVLGLVQSEQLRPDAAALLVRRDTLQGDAAAPSRVSLHGLDTSGHLLPEATGAVDMRLASLDAEPLDALPECRDARQLCRASAAAPLLAARAWPGRAADAEQLLLCDGTRLVQVSAAVDAASLQLEWHAVFGSHLAAQNGRSGLGHCAGVATDGTRHAWVADSSNHRVVALSLEPTEPAVDVTVGAVELLARRADIGLAGTPVASDAENIYMGIAGCGASCVATDREAAAGLARVRAADLVVTGSTPTMHVARWGLVLNTMTQVVAVAWDADLRLDDRGRPGPWLYIVGRGSGPGLVLKLELSTMTVRDSVALDPSLGVPTAVAVSGAVLLVVTDSQPATVVMADLTTTLYGQSTRRLDAPAQRLLEETDAAIYGPRQRRLATTSSQLEPADGAAAVAVRDRAVPPRIYLGMDTAPGRVLVVLHDGTVAARLELPSSAGPVRALAVAHQRPLSDVAVLNAADALLFVAVAGNETGGNETGPAAVHPLRFSPGGGSLSLAGDPWQLDAGLQPTSLVFTGNHLHVACGTWDGNGTLGDGERTQHLRLRVRVPADSAPVLLEPDAASVVERPGHVQLLSVHGVLAYVGSLAPDPLQTWCLSDAGAGTVSAMAAGAVSGCWPLHRLTVGAAPALDGLQRMRYLAAYGLAEPGFQGGGFVATRETTGMDGPVSIAYAALPEPCLYVVEEGNHRLLQLRIVGGGAGLEYAGHFGESGYSGADTQHFNEPLAVAVGDGLLVYVLDGRNKRVMALTVGRLLGRLSYFRHFALGLAGTTLVSGPGTLAMSPPLSAGVNYGAWTSYVQNKEPRFVLRRMVFQEPVSWSLEQSQFESGVAANLRFGFQLAQGFLPAAQAGLWPMQPRLQPARPVVSSYPGLTLRGEPALAWSL